MKFRNQRRLLERGISQSEMAGLEREQYSRWREQSMQKPRGKREQECLDS